jgi:hypothetical protein
MLVDRTSKEKEAKPTKEKKTTVGEERTKNGQKVDFRA